jgi:protein TonB
MNTQFRAAVFSIAVHALIFTSIIVISRSMPANKPLVIDFSVAGGQGPKVEAYRTPSQGRRPAVKRQENKLKEQMHKATPQPTPDTVPDKNIMTASETQAPVVTTTSNTTGPVDQKAAIDKDELLQKNVMKGTGPVSGNGPDQNEGSVKAVYLKDHFVYIRDLIMKNISYPHMARKMGWMGKVTLSFVICENGHAEDIKIIESSGFAILDKNAVETVKKVLPLPKPPLRAEIVIPLVYRLN